MHKNPWEIENIEINDDNEAAILRTFIIYDDSKLIQKKHLNIKKTNDFIGEYVYTAPEQFNSNKYTYKVDSYSIGMIIHFIITRKNYNFSYDDLSEIYKKKENISKNDKFPKCPPKYEFILNIYYKSFEILPNSRPSIVSLIATLIFDNDNNLLMSSNERELPCIINQIENYEQ